MSHQDPKTKAWIIPPAQEKEFMSGPIDYATLIANCMRNSSVPTVKVKPAKVEKKKKSIWQTEITFGR